MHARLFSIVIRVVVVVVGFYCCMRLTDKTEKNYATKYNTRGVRTLSYSFAFLFR